MLSNVHISNRKIMIFQNQCQSQIVLSFASLFVIWEVSYQCQLSTLVCSKHSCKLSGHYYHVCNSMKNNDNSMILPHSLINFTSDPTQTPLPHILLYSLTFFAQIILYLTVWIFTVVGHWRQTRSNELLLSQAVFLSTQNVQEHFPEWFSEYPLLGRQQAAADLGR